MIRTRGLKTEFTPVTKIGENVYYIKWDQQPVIDRIRQKNELTGEEEIIEQDSDYATWMIEILHNKPSK